LKQETPTEVKPVALSQSAIQKEEKPLPPSTTVPEVRQTPLQQKREIRTKTPHVTGGWIDTPLPKGSKVAPKAINSQDIKQHDSEPEEVRSVLQNILAFEKSVKLLEETAPALPHSALSAVLAELEDSGLAEEDLQVGDATLQDLKAMLENDTDPLEERLKAEEGLAPPLNEGASNGEDTSLKKPLPPLPNTASLRKAESDSLASALSRLQKLEASMSETRTGMSNLEQIIERVSPKPLRKRLEPPPSSTPSATETLDTKPPQGLLTLADMGECTEGGQLHDFIIPCSKCGTFANSIKDDALVQWQVIQMPRLWVWKKNDYVPRFTRLGWIVILLTALAVAEKIAQYVIILCVCPNYHQSNLLIFLTVMHTPHPSTPARWSALASIRICHGLRSCLPSCSGDISCLIPACRYGMYCV
jgi:hypothetical protein